MTGSQIALLAAVAAGVLYLWITALYFDRPVFGWFIVMGAGIVITVFGGHYDDPVIILLNLAFFGFVLALVFSDLKCPVIDAWAAFWKRRH